MIDKITLRCDFKNLPLPKTADLHTFVDGDLSKSRHDYADYANDFLLGLVDVQLSIDADGNMSNLRHVWESLPSSYSSMAFKVFDNRDTQLHSFYIEITASPAKLMLGHNLYGSSDFKACAYYMIWLLKSSYVQLFEFLDMTTWFVVSVDITYFSRANSQLEAKEFINALHRVSYGQTKSRTGYDGTAYFGKKNSRLKKIKIYSKYAETLEQKKKDIKKVLTDELVVWSDSMIRFEVSLFHRYFQRRELDCNLSNVIDWLGVDMCEELWMCATADLFKAFEGEEFVMKEDDVHQRLREKFFKVSEKTGNISYAAADAAFKTYRFIKNDGWLAVFESMPRRTFYRHVAMLQEIGLSRVVLQNMNGIESNVIPFMRFVTVEFGKQFPDGVTDLGVIKPYQFHVKQVENILKRA
jgi:II/X family phage/plasmid replication protein